MSKPKRLHPVVIFLLLLKALKELMIPIIAAFVFGRGATSWDFPFTIYFIICGFIIFFIYGYFKWYTYTYEVDGVELKIKQGIFIKKNRFIRRERIYSIDITAGVFQRLFHLVAVKVETAGGGTEPEVVLAAVTKKDALQIKRQLLAVSVENGNEMNEAELSVQSCSEIQWRLSNKNLVLAALTSSGIGIAFMALVALASQLEDWILNDYLINSFGYIFQSSAAVIIVAATIIFFLSWLISIIGTILKYGNFIIRKKDDEIEIARGILEKRQLTISITRITAIRVVESLFRQPFGLATVYVESAGGGSKDEQLSTVLFPLVRIKELKNHLGEIIPDFCFEQPIEPLPKRAKTRYVIRKVVPGAIIAGFTVFFIPYGFFGAALVLFLALLIGNQQFKDAGFGKNDRFLWISYRALSKTLVIIPKQRIQALEIKQSLFQQLRTLFTIQASILTSIVGKAFRTVDISEKQKEELLTWYSYEETKGKKV
jgi:putative membrane protein